MKTKILRSGAGKLKSNENLQSYLMLSVSLIGTIMFVIYPLLWILRYCLFRYDGYNTPVFVGLSNFVRAFTSDQRFWSSVVNTFIFAFGKLTVEIPLALVLACLLCRKIKGVSFFRTILYLPAVLSIAVIGIVFYYLFASYNGVVNEILRQLGFISRPISWFSNKWLAMLVLMIASIWQYFGLNMIFFLTGMQSISDELYESADIDGANGVQQFFKITIPMLGPVMQMIVMNAILGSMKVTDIVLVLTYGRPNGGTEVMMTYIYKLFFGTSAGTASDYGYSSALVFITAGILGLMTFIYLKTTNKNAKIY